MKINISITTCWLGSTLAHLKQLCFSPYNFLSDYKSNVYFLIYPQMYLSPKMTFDGYKSFHQAAVQ